MSKSERHRLNAMRHEAKKHGIKVREWPLGAREQVGMYLIGLLEGAGMIEVLPCRIQYGKNVPPDVVFTASLLSKIDKIKAYVALTRRSTGRAWSRRWIGRLVTTAASTRRGCAAVRRCWCVGRRAAGTCTARQRCPQCCVR
jgi:hypothetical protein